MADVEKQVTTETPIRTELPTGRVKRIMKLDKEINKVNSDALFLVTSSAELFLRFLADKSSQVAGEKKRKTVNLDHLLIAVKRHRPTSDFLLDSLTQSHDDHDNTGRTWRTKKHVAMDKPLPTGTRTIDSFFRGKSDADC